MALILQKTFLRPQPTTLQLKRFRGKINIQKPRAPHYERALFNAVTEPKIPKPKITELCYNNQLAPAKIQPATKIVDNPYEKIIAKEFFNWLEHSKFVGIFHLNSINSEDLFKARVAFFKQNMHLKMYGKSIIRLGIQETKYEAILPLVQTKNCFVFSAESKPAKVLAITKKIPQMILLAGIAENRLLSKTQIVDYANLSDLTTCRAQFVAVLNSIGGGLVQHMQTHQQQLTAMLDAYAVTGEKQNKPENSNSSETPGSVEKDST